MEATLPKSRRVSADPRGDIHEHRSGLGFTDGVKVLLEGANAAWFLNVIAILQGRTLCDPWLREFQLWELFRQADRQVVIVCSFDSEDVAFRLEFGCIDVSLDYVRLYVTRGIVCRPADHRGVLRL